MDMGIEGKAAVITGAASGLGRETARYLVRDGAKVLLSDVNQENLDALAQELTTAGGTVETTTTDVRDYGECERLAATAKDKFGGVDLLLASAGVGGAHQFFVDSTPDDWELMLQVNVRGILNTNRCIAPLMVERKSGSIVNIASEAGKVGEKRIVVYSATKGAVISFSKAFALEMGRFKVRVNAVCPGVTRTAMTTHFGNPGDATYEAAAKLYPLGRLGEPEDVASLITYLLSSQSGWITGQAISVNGGFGRS